MIKQIPFITVTWLLLTSCAGAAPGLGVNSGKLMSCPTTPNCVSSQASDEEHYIEPLAYPGPRKDAQDRLLQIIESEQRTKIITIEENYIRAEFTSTLFRFVDDVEFYFPEQQGDETRIHIRSASRVGRSDLGANRKRIERIRSKLITVDTQQ